MEKDQANNEHTKLERQVERGELFTHTILSHHSIRINEVESFVYAIIDILSAKNIAIPDELMQAVDRVKKEILEKNEVSTPGLALRVDDENEDEFIPVNCEERLSVCKAVCCKLDFALNAEEIESGNIKWDLGRPYFIRHETDCYCAHLHRENFNCKVYNTRPSVCKKYSCAKDERIWKNFQKMELNEEWIAKNLKEKRPKFLGAPMFTDQKLTDKIE